MQVQRAAQAELREHARAAQAAAELLQDEGAAARAPKRRSFASGGSGSASGCDSGPAVKPALPLLAARLMH